IDVADPAHPAWLGPVIESAPGPFALAPPFVFVTNTDRTGPALRAMDLRDPSRPIEVGSYPLLGSALRVVAHGDSAYVAGQRLWTADFADPAAPGVAILNSSSAFRTELTMTNGALIAVSESLPGQPFPGLRFDVA